MYGQYRKIDRSRVLKPKSQGVSSVQIARRLDVSVAAVSLVLREAKSDTVAQAKSSRVLGNDRDQATVFKAGDLRGAFTIRQPL